MNNADQYLRKKLDERLAAGNLRQLPAQRQGIDFSSNDYLGIATNGLLINEGTHGATGSTGSRLISGNSTEVEETEALIARFHRAEAALIFNSGYDANLGLLSAIAGKDTIFIYDELCHASIIDGIRLSICRHRYRYPHNDIQELEGLLQKHSRDAQVYVVTESVFSMDGDVPPLARIVSLCAQYNAQLIVDEAHATGVIGPQGRGLVCSLGIEDQVFARVHTFGKALGCHGAAVVGSALLRQYLINFARSFIYTTALPPQSIQVIGSTYRYLLSGGFSNTTLHTNIAHFKQKIAEHNIQGSIDSITPIQAIVVGGNDSTRQLAAHLQKEGFLVNAILHPTVPLGMERLRICLHSFNTLLEIDTLINLISQWQRTL